MQQRLSRGPHATLGLDDDASPEDVRAAFLALTKQFHPARFGRMSNELQRLSNEVFLGIKSAHESMMRALGAGLRPGMASRQSGSMPVVQAEGSSKMPVSRPPSPAPRANGTQQPIRNPSPAIPRTFTPGSRTPSPTVVRTPPPAAGTGATPPFGVRVGIGARPGTPPGTPPGPPVVTRPGAPPQQPPHPSSKPPPMTERGVGVGPIPQKTAPVFDERVELKQALDHMAANNFAAARSVLNGLAARLPTSKQYRALLCYTRGREAQLAGKGEEAVMELQRALQLDPDLSQAKSALAELLRRR